AWSRGSRRLGTARATPHPAAVVSVSGAVGGSGRTGAHHTLASAADARYKTPESGLRFLDPDTSNGGPHAAVAQARRARRGGRGAGGSRRHHAGCGRGSER